ncbi:MAG: HAD-IA family hydrolase [Deltaproteobacteria bacterium]|nr:HAD-IA family hydrolase [Deltaproteobacteria bacterium]
MTPKTSSIRAVLFDFDGTLTKPGALDFPEFKKSVGCPVDKPVLEFIDTLSNPNEKSKAMAALDRFELKAATSAEPNQGAEEIISYLKSKKLCIGIISRNSRRAIDRAFQNFNSVGSFDFDLIFSRDEPVKPKPDPQGILLAAKKLNVNVDQIMVVGDYHFDIEAGNAAGAVTVFLDNGIATQMQPSKSDYRINNLSELKHIIRMLIPLPAGKFPNDLLEEFFSQFQFEDPSVLISAGVGEDTAAVDINNEQVLVLKSDPITFATDAIGEYAVVVNANDIATSGAVPRWLLTTLLFPCGATVSEIWHTMEELQGMCRKWGITLCGGHTEITDAVTRPVITGMLAGTVKRKNLICKWNMRPGDHVLLTKAIAVEGTAIAAREFADRLRKSGMSEADIENCRRFLSQISILTEAKIAGSTQGTSAMHDVTEGGLATAVKELAIAGRHRIRIDMERIPVFPQTQRISEILGIDPMGLIGSGSLLICCRKSSAEGLIEKIQAEGIRITHIGEVLEPGQGIEAVKNGKRVRWPCFEVDEITRLFQ